MRYGYVRDVTVYDNGDAPIDRSAVLVSVDFIVSRSVLFEFMDALRPIDQKARREPIQAILDYSSELGIEVEE